MNCFGFCCFYRSDSKLSSRSSDILEFTGLLNLGCILFITSDMSQIVNPTWFTIAPQHHGFGELKGSILAGMGVD